MCVCVCVCLTVWRGKEGGGGCADVIFKSKARKRCVLTNAWECVCTLFDISTVNGVMEMVRATVGVISQLKGNVEKM